MNELTNERLNEIIADTGRPKMHWADCTERYKMALELKAKREEYDGATLTVKHLVADAWIPAWEEKSNHLDCVDGNEKNTSANNLRPSASKKKGAKRDNLPLRVFKAMELALHCRNVKLAALESGLTVEDVVFGFCRYMPHVLRKDSPYRFVGMPKTIERVGMPKDIARMVRLGEISIKAVSEEE